MTLAVVTGATGGIGLATTLQLARRGYDVVGISRERPAGTLIPDDILVVRL